MKNLLTIRNAIIILLCITIISLGIGFAYLSMKLEKQSNLDFNVSFTKITQKTPVQGGTQKPSCKTEIMNSGKTLNMQFNLYTPRDELSYEIIIKNEGTLDAKIINLIEEPDYLNNAGEAKNILPVTISHNDIVGKILKPEEEIKLTINIVYSYSATVVAKQIPYQIHLLVSTPLEDK